MKQRTTKRARPSKAIYVPPIDIELTEEEKMDQRQGPFICRYFEPLKSLAAGERCSLFGPVHSSMARWGTH
jgi:hypothetical protein